ncbi:hypothetical protein RB195_016720 [Necator americanus]
MNKAVGIEVRPQLANFSWIITMSGVDEGPHRSQPLAQPPTQVQRGPSCLNPTRAPTVSNVLRKRCARDKESHRFGHP